MLMSSRIPCPPYRRSTRTRTYEHMHCMGSADCESPVPAYSVRSVQYTQFRNFYKEQSADARGAARHAARSHTHPCQLDIPQLDIPQ